MTPPAVMAKLRLAWAWFVDGLVEALIWAMRRGRRPVPFRLVIGESDGAVLNAEGTRIGRLVSGGPTPGIEPPDLARRLAGRDLDLVIPPAWMVRRSLAPVAAQSRPFLDVFVRHQIERISPWRADAVHHRTLVEPLPSDPTRLGVAVVLVPKRLVERWLAPLEHFDLGSLRLRTAADDSLTIVVGGSEPRGVASLRRGVAWGLAGLATAAVLLCGVLQWEAGVVASDLEEQNNVLAERRIVLAKARQREGSDDGLSSKLLALRDARPSAVAIIDALAQAVPDTAHLTTLSIDKDGVSISGLSTDPSALVPALETSGHFADVVTSAATIRTESGDADRFSLSMRALLPSASSPVAPTARAERKAGP
jgi:general secretion pathway protein L